MRKISYFLHFLLVVIILTGICTALAAEESTAGTIASGTCGENLTWVLTHDGVLTISGEGAMDDLPPWWNYCETIKTVVIDSGVTSICDCAFSGCASLTSITIPDGVTSIGWNAFAGCNSLTTITIPGSVTSIERPLAFSTCASLTDIIVSENNQNYCDVDGVLFTKDMSTLMVYPIATAQTTYEIPDGVTEIDDSAFSG
ncbi:MAG: leucine-rich repeat domain-containing protein, partial [Oscillospiraceae bacterium]|nr:leucine-rich repeat domain-containing protein [Oscillospiraceae bacterium]